MTVPVSTAKSKGEVYLMLKEYNRETVKGEMHETLIKSRNVPLKEARNIKTLFPKEVNTILKHFDYITE